MTKILLLAIFLFANTCQAQLFPIPGPGRGPKTPGSWSLNSNNYNGLCPGACSSIGSSAFASAGTGKYVRIWVFGCGDAACSTDPTVGLISSIVSNGSETIVFDSYSAAENLPVWCYHITSTVGDATSITANFSPDAYFAGIFWSSYSFTGGTPATDETAAGSAASGTSLSVTTSGNLDQSDELIVALCVGSTDTTTGMGFTALNTAVSNTEDEYLIGGTAGMTTTATCTQAMSGRWHIVIATTKL